MEITPEQLQRGRFWKKYLRLTRGGVGTLRAMEVIIEEERSEAFRDVICAVRDDVEGGGMFSEALARFPDHFSLSVRELIRTAEKEGHWDLVVEELAEGLLDGTFD